MRKITADLIETPGDEKPYKVVVTREGLVVSEVAVASKVAGEAMIRDIMDGGQASKMDLR